MGPRTRARRPAPTLEQPAKVLTTAFGPRAVAPLEPSTWSLMVRCGRDAGVTRIGVTGRRVDGPVPSHFPNGRSPKAGPRVPSRRIGAAPSPWSHAAVIPPDIAYVEGMRILIVGPGVIGTVYGVKLLERGHEVIVLARGERLIELQEHGLILEDAERGHRTVLPVSVVDGVTAGDRYDLVLAPVRRDQLRGIVPVVRKLSDGADVLVFGNATGLCNELRASLGQRVLFGFPAAGGTYDGKVVRYVLIRQQKTMLGEPDGRASSRLRNLREVFADAGFPTLISGNAAGWLNAHTAFVVPIAYALYRFDTDAARLAADRPTLLQMVRATRQAFRALRAAGEADIPGNLKMLYLRMPEGFAVGYWRRVLAGPRGELWFAAHSRAAPEEMASLAVELLAAVHRSKRPSPDLDALLPPGY